MRSTVATKVIANSGAAILANVAAVPCIQVPNVDCVCQPEEQMEKRTWNVYGTLTIEPVKCQQECVEEVSTCVEPCVQACAEHCVVPSAPTCAPATENVVVGSHCPGCVTQRAEPACGCAPVFESSSMQQVPATSFVDHVQRILTDICTPRTSASLKNIPTQANMLPRLQSILGMNPVVDCAEARPERLAEYLTADFQSPQLREEQAFVLNHYEELRDSYLRTIRPHVHNLVDMVYHVNSETFYQWLKGESCTPQTRQLIDKTAIENHEAIVFDAAGQFIPVLSESRADNYPSSEEHIHRETTTEQRFVEDLEVYTSA